MRNGRTCSNTPRRSVSPEGLEIHRLNQKHQTLSNLVNYKTFGFTKIIPRVASEKFQAVVSHSANKKATALWNEVCVNLTGSIRTLTFPKLKDHIYTLTPESNLFIGKRSLGHISNYYLGEPISDEEVGSVQTAAEALGIDVLNTRYVIAFTTRPVN